MPNLEDDHLNRLRNPAQRLDAAVQTRATDSGNAPWPRYAIASAPGCTTTRVPAGVAADEHPSGAEIRHAEQAFRNEFQAAPLDRPRSLRPRQSVYTSRVKSDPSITKPPHFASYATVGRAAMTSLSDSPCDFNFATFSRIATSMSLISTSCARFPIGPWPGMLFSCPRRPLPQ